MVTGCGCTDPVVFGHQAACERELGPSYAGDARSDRQRTAGQFSQEYEPPGVPNPFSDNIPWHSIMAATAPKCL